MSIQVFTTINPVFDDPLNKCMKIKYKISMAEKVLMYFVFSKCRKIYSDVLNLYKRTLRFLYCTQSCEFEVQCYCI